MFCDFWFFSLVWVFVNLNCELILVTGIRLNLHVSYAKPVLAGEIITSAHPRFNKNCFEEDRFNANLIYSVLTRWIYVKVVRIWRQACWLVNEVWLTNRFLIVVDLYIGAYGPWRMAISNLWNSGYQNLANNLSGAIVNNCDLRLRMTVT